MASARDRMFGGLVKEVTRWQVPTVALAFITQMNLASAIAAFAAAAAPAVPHFVDYIVQRREIGRRHGIGYLIGLSDMSPDKRPPSILRSEA